jgi:hypothetical protein
MDTLAKRIAAELQALIGQPISDCWRATNMQIFEFGPRRQITNRRGEEIEVCELRLHIQCRWRFVSPTRILFARDDLNYPADDEIPIEEFDWDKQDSVLDEKQRAWFGDHRATPPTVQRVEGDRYGGFRIELSGGFALECFPCDSQQGDYSEHWRMLGHRADGSHFVITGDGVETDDEVNGDL